MQDESTTVNSSRPQFTVDSDPYACRCGAVVYWRATETGLTVLGTDGQPHRPVCPLRHRPPVTSRRWIRPDLQPATPAPVVVTVKSDLPPRLYEKLVDAVSEIPLAVDETRHLGQQVARYAAQVDARSRRPAVPPQPPRPAQPPARPTGETTKGASVVRARRSQEDAREGGGSGTTTGGR